jgi:hypothetical protein
MQVIKSRKLAGRVARLEGGEVHLFGKPEPLGRHRRRWEGNIKTDIAEVGWEGVDWIDLAEDRDKCRALVNTMINLWVP